ncbi:DNA/RNA non-specific endonuclease [Acidobacteria bacterium AH-259-A15]|nr:DNA/RNA non-specific endonuclease [Acidobacteria bacterium AH-259-A15]
MVKEKHVSFRLNIGMCRTLIYLVLVVFLFQTPFAQSDIEQRLERLEAKIDRLLAFHELDREHTQNWRFLSQTCDGRLLNKQFFVICHNDEWKIPYWVGYYLSKENLTGSVRRTNDFRPDPELQSSERAELTDYRNSGYDRGHMAPAAAFKRSRTAMSTTFLLSNMAPQTATLNRRIWRLLEEDVREVAREIGDVWIFTGNLFRDSDGNPTEPSKLIGENEVAVPTHCFKVILLKTATDQWQMFGFIMPNQRESIPGPLTDYQVTIDRIEEASGLDFFAELPDLLENDLESKRPPWPVQ